MVRASQAQRPISTWYLETTVLGAITRKDDWDYLVIITFCGIFHQSFNLKKESFCTSTKLHRLVSQFDGFAFVTPRWKLRPRFRKKPSLLFRHFQTILFYLFLSFFCAQNFHKMKLLIPIDDWLKPELSSMCESSWCFTVACVRWGVHDILSCRLGSSRIKKEKSD